MNDAVQFLKDYIWKNGFEKLSENPFSVYEGMVKNCKNGSGIDPKTARLVLVTLLSKTHEMARKGLSQEEIVDHIQSEHCLNKKAARDIASMYLELFNDENKKSWDDALESGFEDFCEAEWTIEWEGTCDWHTKYGRSFPCSAWASLTVNVEDKQKLHNHLASELKANPFLSEDDIYGILAKEIEDGLDEDMQEYCDADDYYEPVWEDFAGEGTYESEERWKSWGLEIVEFTGSGDIDYEP
ncbi:MAG: hypothetical protein Q4A32_01540 [Lachnospiraceae bacterium]|nr:hypothetical protein [Lachnospiraceae bacterium]